MSTNSVTATPSSIKPVYKGAQQLPNTRTTRARVVTIAAPVEEGPQLHPGRKMNNIRKEIQAQAQARAQAAQQQLVQAKLPQNPQVQPDRQSAAPQIAPNDLKNRITKEVPPCAAKVSSWSLKGFAQAVLSWLWNKLPSNPFKGIFSKKPTPQQESVVQKSPQEIEAERTRIQKAHYAVNEAWADQTLQKVSGNLRFLAGNGTRIDKVDSMWAAATAHVDKPENGDSWHSRIQFRQTDERLADLNSRKQKHIETVQANLDSEEPMDSVAAADIGIRLNEDIDALKQSKLDHIRSMKTSQMRVFKHEDKSDKHFQVPGQNGRPLVSRAPSAETESYFLMLSEKGGAQVSNLNSPESDAVVIDIQTEKPYPASEFTKRTGINPANIDLS